MREDLELVLDHAEQYQGEHELGSIEGAAITRIRASLDKLAAAHDLYKATKAFVENLTDGFGACDACHTLSFNHEDGCLVPLAAAALAKARGETNGT